MTVGKENYFIIESSSHIDAIKDRLMVHFNNGYKRHNDVDVDVDVEQPKGD